MLVDQIFVRALKEPKHVEMYAQLCADFSKDFPEIVAANASKQVLYLFSTHNVHLQFSFRRVLLGKCQTEFETNKWKANKRESIENLNPEQREEQLLIQEKNRVLFMGNIAFIGELFKLSMLKPSIIQKCLATLLKELTVLCFSLLC